MQGDDECQQKIGTAIELLASLRKTNVHKASLQKFSYFCGILVSL